MKNRDDTTDVLAAVEGTQMEVWEIAERWEIPEDEVATILENNGLERCSECDTWVECGELEEGVCDSCR